jgi:transposase
VLGQRGEGVLRRAVEAHKRRDRISQWLVQLIARVGWQKAAVALANKNAHILWAVLAKGRRFDANHVSLKRCDPP